MIISKFEITENASIGINEETFTPKRRTVLQIEWNPEALQDARATGKTNEFFDALAKEMVFHLNKSGKSLSESW